MVECIYLDPAEQPSGTWTRPTGRYAFVGRDNGAWVWQRVDWEGEQ